MFDRLITKREKVDEKETKINLACNV